MNKEKKKILLYGIGSLQNKGCEAIVDSVIEQINEAEIVLATFDYENDKKIKKEKIKKYINHHRQNYDEFTESEKKKLEKYQNMPFDYNNYELLYQRDVVKELEKSDLAIHVGGDNYCYGVNEWMYSINTKAKQLGKKTVLFGASLFDEITDLDLIINLKKYDLLMLREKISYNAIKKYIPEEKLMLIPDPAFSLKKKEVKLNSWYKNRKIVGLNLSPLTIKSEENYNDIKELINYILKNTDYSICLIPHVMVEEVSDYKILDRIAEDYKNEKRLYLERGNYDCKELKYIISKCSLLIAARTHASIAAYSTCVPTLVLGYSVKSRGIAEDIFGNYKDYVLPIEDINKDTLIEKFDYLNKNQNNIRKILKEKMLIIIKESEQLYENMCSRLDTLEKEKICKETDCVCCQVCANVCPKNAITMVKNEEGFLYPKIDLKKCINCGLCRKKCCRNIENIQQTKALECYAAKSKEKDILQSSSSGGVFYYLAKEILTHQGIVYGATISSLKVRHIRINEVTDIKKIQGSKYSQSNLKDIFPKVKTDLEENKKVLFSGTPCQILALRTYLGKDYSKLYTVSIICHGVINDDILEKRVREIEKNFDTEIEEVKYKSKVNGWDASSIEYKTKRINKAYKFADDPMMSLFVDNYILRESCYDCPSKGKNNVADIILGDYWGIYNVHKEFFDKKGTSAVIINTDKGAKLFNKVKNKFLLQETKYKSIEEYNQALKTSAKRPIERNIIFSEINENTFKLLEQAYNTQKLELANEKIMMLSQKLQSAEQKLTNISNSKRYRFINKLANIKSKLDIRKRRKK